MGELTKSLELRWQKHRSLKSGGPVRFRTGTPIFDKETTDDVASTVSSIFSVVSSRITDLQMERKMSIVYLKIKIKSLSAEAQIIRHEEQKYLDRRLGSFWQSLNDHRRKDVRREARSALLAYGFLRGRQLSQIEGKCHERPDQSRVMSLVKKYGSPGAHHSLSEWLAPLSEKRAMAA